MVHFARINVESAKKNGGGGNRMIVYGKTLYLRVFVLYRYGMQQRLCERGRRCVDRE